MVQIKTSITINQLMLKISKALLSLPVFVGPNAKLNASLILVYAGVVVQDILGTFAKLVR